MMLSNILVGDTMYELFADAVNIVIRYAQIVLLTGALIVAQAQDLHSIDGMTCKNYVLYIMDKMRIFTKNI